MSAAGRALSKALDRPEDWHQPDEYRIAHKPSGLAFWIANGRFFFNGDGLRGTPRCLGLLERHWLYSKARRAVLRTGSQTVAERLLSASLVRDQQK